MPFVTKGWSDLSRMAAPLGPGDSVNLLRATLVALSVVALLCGLITMVT